MPRAIALSPILSARYRPEDVARIAAAAPGARLVTLSREGLADGPVDDVEVLLHGFLAADAYERLLARAPSLRWVHSAAAGVERLLTPSGARARALDHQRAGRLQPAHRRVRADDGAGREPPPPAAAGAPGRTDLAAPGGTRAARRHARHRRASGASGGRLRSSPPRSDRGSSRRAAIPGRAPATRRCLPAWSSAVRTPSVTCWLPPTS